jgi:molecular chaperone GrpE
VKSVALLLFSAIALGTVEMDDRDRDKSNGEPPAFQIIDKRHFLDLDTLDKTPVEEKPRYPSYVEELIGRMAEMERKFEERKKQIDEEIVRTKTRLENDFQRRLDLEKHKIILPFLEVLDNLRRAIDASSQTGSVEHLLEGVQMTANLFHSKLQAIGVELIPALNQPFDPNVGQAVGTVPVTQPARDGVVVEEVQSGYTMNGQLLRPAMVRVGHLD